MYNKKKILIINGTSLTSNDATGITVRSIFENLNRDDWFEISCSPSAKDANYKGKKTYSLPHKYYPFYSILNKSFFKNANKVSKNNVKIASINSKNKMSIMLRNSVIAYADILPLLPPKDLLEKVENFKPDCIYTLGASVLTMKLALYFSKAFNIKIVMHFMDNWPDTLYKEGFITIPCHYIMQNKLKKIYDHMDCGMTISDKMAEEYTKRWNKEHIPLMNVVSKIEENPLIREDDKAIIFTYAGGLHLERWKSLLKISETIKRESIFTNKKIEVRIYTSFDNRETYEYLFDKNTVKFYDYVEHNSISKVYKSSDVLIHIESFDPDIVKFTKFSLSTKISEYMSSGKPILLYAPENIAVSEYISEHKAGLTCRNSEELSCSIKKLVNSKELRSSLATNGISCAKENHSIDNALNRLDKAFKNIN